jgi:hypothetical protein
MTATAAYTKNLTHPDGGVGGWLEDKTRRAIRDIVHEPADTVRMYYNATVLSSRDFGSRAGYELGLVSKRRMRTDIANARRYGNELVRSELETLRHPLRDPYATFEIVHNVREHVERLRHGEEEEGSSSRN